MVSFVLSCLARNKKCYFFLCGGKCSFTLVPNMFVIVSEYSWSALLASNPEESWNVNGISEARRQGFLFFFTLARLVSTRLREARHTLSILVSLQVTSLQGCIGPTKTSWISIALSPILLRYSSTFSYLINLLLRRQRQQQGD